MALFNTRALRQRFREVLIEGQGSVRTVASDLGGQHAPGASDAAIRHRTLAKPQLFVPYIKKEQHGARGTEFGSIRLYDIEVRVLVIYDLPEPIHDHATRDNAIGDAEQDVDEIVQALGYPGNLSQTSGGTDTNLIDGWLDFKTDDSIEESFERNKLAVELRFRGQVHVTMPT